MPPEPTLRPVQTQDVAAQIRVLNQMRREATWWRYGALAVMALTVAYSITSLRNSALALAQPGPIQSEFTTKLSSGLQRDVYPNVQRIAAQTVTEMRPQVTASFEKINNRAPEVAQASLAQLNELQQNLPARSEKILDETFSAELQKRESKIREMFPDVTDDKIKKLVTNMTEVGKKRMPHVADQIMGKHVAAVNGIMDDVLKIHAQEKVNGASDAATWEMTLAVIDLVRDDVLALAPAEAKNGGETAPAGPGAAPSLGKKEAKK